MRHLLKTVLGSVSAAFLLSACASAGSSRSSAEVAKGASESPLKGLNPSKQKGRQDKNPVVATVNGIDIRLSEIDGELSAQFKALEQKYLEELYELRSETLRERVRQALLESEAKRLNMTKEELVREFITKKAFEGLDEKARAFYQENVEDFEGASFDDIEENLTRVMFQYRSAEIEEEYIGSLAERAKVKLNLSPPRLQVKAEGPSQGKGTKVNLVVFSDFECPYCTRLYQNLNEVMKQRGEVVRLVFRHFPLQFHEKAKPAHMAAACAEEQNLFWKAHDYFFESGELALEPLVFHLKKEAGFNELKFKECLSDGRGFEKMQADLAYGTELGVQGTPTFFINGLRFTGAREAEEIIRMIDAELAH